MSPKLIWADEGQDTFLVYDGGDLSDDGFLPEDIAQAILAEAEKVGLKYGTVWIRSVLPHTAAHWRLASRYPMLTQSEHWTITHYVSEVLPEVTTQDPDLGKTIAWADANPVVWKIVTNTRSKAFGRKSSEFIGWAQRSPAPEAILERARHFHTCVDPNVLGGLHYRSRDIWGWRARFTFEHYQGKGFTGGFFQRFDGHYDRDCMTLDYTPETLLEVVRNFMEWGHFPLDGESAETVRIDKVSVPTEILTAARKRRCTTWDPPGEFFTKRGLVSSIR